MRGVIKSINISRKKGKKKVPVSSATLIANYGIDKDAHAGDPIRQVSLLSTSDIERMKRDGLNINFGDFAENLAVDGIDVLSLKIGDKILISSAVLEITQIGKECHTRCNIYKQVGYCIMPESGVFMRVIDGGEIKVGDIVEVISCKETNK